MLKSFFIERGLLRTITRSLWAPVITNKRKKNNKQTNQLISDLFQSYFFFNYFF